MLRWVRARVAALLACATLAPLGAAAHVRPPHARSLQQQPAPQRLQPQQPPQPQGQPAQPQQAPQAQQPAQQPAPANPQARARLAWARAEGAEGCPDGAALQRDVAQQLGRDPFAPDAPASVEATVTRAGGRWVAGIYVRDATGALAASRELTSDAASCDAIADAVAFAIAVAIDPDAALTPAPERRAPQPEPVAPVVAPPVVAPVRPVVVTRSLPGDVAVALRFEGVAGLLPGVAFGPALATDVPLARRVAVTIVAAFYPPASASDSALGFSFGLTTARAAGCYAPWESGRLVSTVCLGAALGAVHVVSRRLPPSDSPQRWWGAVVGTARLAARIAGPFAVEVGVDALAPLVRYRFQVVTVEGAQGMEVERAAVFEQSAVAAAAWLAVGARFR